MGYYKRGFTCSAFDLLHAGHVLMLQEAKSHCDYLIVGLHIDPSTDRKSKNKPAQTVSERWIQLRAIKYVDEIIPYESEQELLSLLKLLRLDVRIIGEEYRDKDFTGKQECKDLGIDICYNSRKHGYSSSELRSRLKLRANQNEVPS